MFVSNIDVWDWQDTETHRIFHYFFVLDLSLLILLINSNRTKMINVILLFKVLYNIVPICCCWTQLCPTLCDPMDCSTQASLTFAAAAKLLQSCPTLCDPIDGSPQGSPVPEILQARTLEGVAISFSNAWKWKVKVKSPSLVRLLATPWTAAHQAPLSMGFSRQEYWSGMPLPSPSLTFTISQSLLKLMSIESVIPSNHLNLCGHLLLLPSIFPRIRVFSNELALRIRWPKYYNFSFSISSSNEYSGLISFRMDWFDLLAVQGPLKILLQHHSSKASILWCSAFFMVQISHPYMTTGKTIVSTRQTFVSKVMSLLFNMLSR